MFERPFYPPYQVYDGYADYSYGGPYPEELGWPHQDPSGMPVYSQTPFEYFAKPAQPTSWPGAFGPQSKSASAFKSNEFLTYFQDKDGQLDLHKMLTTAEQFANTFQQITPLVKQVGSLVKSLK